jgi:hypothetical protein
MRSWQAATRNTGFDMAEETTKRIAIIASIIGAVGAIVYLLKGDRGTVQQILSGGGSGTIGGPGPAGAPGAAGAGGAAGAAGAPGAAGGAGAPGAAGGVGPAGPAGVSPSLADLAAFFNSGFGVDPGTPVPSIFSNLPPGLDLTKAAGELPTGNGGGGCGGCGGCGGGAGKCPNLQPAIKFVDGRGSCMNSGTVRLQQSMDRCAPGNVEKAAYNNQGNMMYMGLANYDPNVVAQDVVTIMDQIPRLGNPDYTQPWTRFGAV